MPSRQAILTRSAFARPTRAKREAEMLCHCKASLYQNVDKGTKRPNAKNVKEQPRTVAGVSSVNAMKKPASSRAACTAWSSAKCTADPRNAVTSPTPFEEYTALRLVLEESPSSRVLNSRGVLAIVGTRYTSGEVECTTPTGSHLHGSSPVSTASCILARRHARDLHRSKRANQADG